MSHSHDTIQSETKAHMARISHPVPPTNPHTQSHPPTHTPSPTHQPTHPPTHTPSPTHPPTHTSGPNYQPTHPVPPTNPHTQSHPPTHTPSPTHPVPPTHTHPPTHMPGPNYQPTHPLPPTNTHPQSLSIYSNQSDLKINPNSRTGSGSATMFRQATQLQRWLQSHWWSHCWMQVKSYQEGWSPSRWRRGLCTLCTKSGWRLTATWMHMDRDAQRLKHTNNNSIARGITYHNPVAKGLFKAPLYNQLFKASLYNQFFKASLYDQLFKAPLYNHLFKASLCNQLFKASL